MKEQLKTIEIKGKQYVQVAERLRYFNENYIGSITTELLTKPEDKLVVVKATVKVTKSLREEDGGSVQETFTGHSQAIIGDGYINKTSALENAETSAVGRALGMMGIGIIEAVASADEMIKAGVTKEAKHTPEYQIKKDKKIDLEYEAIQDVGLENE